MSGFGTEWILFTRYFRAKYEDKRASIDSQELSIHPQRRTLSVLNRAIREREERLTVTIW